MDSSKKIKKTGIMCLALPYGYCVLFKKVRDFIVVSFQSSCDGEYFLNSVLQIFRFDERVRELLDFSIYLDISNEVKFAWKIQVLSPF